MFNAWKVFTALEKARAETNMSIDPALEQGLHEVALHLATRENILRACVRHLNQHLERVREIAIGIESEQTIVTLEDDFVFSLLLYLNSFVFESHAYVDHLRQFFICMDVDIFRNPDRNEANKKWKAIASGSGFQVRESSLKFLNTTRDQMIHRSCIWPAIDLSRIGEQVFDVILMTKNLHDFENADPDSFLLVQKTYNLVSIGLQGLSETAERDIITRIADIVGNS
jgi:hypothetical protein